MSTEDFKKLEKKVLSWGKKWGKKMSEDMPDITDAESCKLAKAEFIHAFGSNFWQGELTTKQIEKLMVAFIGGILSI